MTNMKGLDMHSKKVRSTPYTENCGTCSRRDAKKTCDYWGSFEKSTNWCPKWELEEIEE